MDNPIDTLQEKLPGQRFHNLVLISRGPNRHRMYNGKLKRISIWNVRCDCGTEYAIAESGLGRIKSCTKCTYGYKRSFQIGDRVGCMVILGLGKRGTNGKAYSHYVMKCDCGETRFMTVNHLRSTAMETCGCSFGRHGFASKRPENAARRKAYTSWCHTKDRCYNPKSKQYPHYGGRGIQFSDEWLRFENFYQDMGDRPEGGSLDRIDPDGPYSKENCRWANNRTQAINRGFNKIYEFMGITLPLCQWVAKIQKEGRVVALPSHNGAIL